MMTSLYKRTSVFVRLGVMGIALVTFNSGYPAPSRRQFQSDEQQTAQGRIAYAALTDEERNLDIYVTSVDSNDPHRLTDSSFAEYDMDWSPDGTQIIFRSDRDGYDGLYIMDADGSNVRPFLENPNEQKRSPAWSPDGKWIAFAAYTPDSATSQNLHLARPDGSDRHHLTHFVYPNFAEHPSWSPNSTQLMFSPRRRASSRCTLSMRMHGTSAAYGRRSGQRLS